MCINFKTAYRAKRAAARFRARYDFDRLNQYTIVEGRLIASGTIVYHVAIYSRHGFFLGYV